MNNIIDFVFVSVLVGLIASFLLSLAEKWGFIEWLQINGADLISKAANCNFCKSFWFCVFVSLVLFAWMHDPFILFCPIVSTNIVKKLL